MGKKFCDKPDVGFPKMKCGYPKPCPHHTVVIVQGAPRVFIPPNVYTQAERVKIRRAAVEINDALESKP
jgi:hypothetical protein